MRGSACSWRLPQSLKSLTLRTSCSSSVARKCNSLKRLRCYLISERSLGRLGSAKEAQSSFATCCHSCALFWRPTVRTIPNSTTEGATWSTWATTQPVLHFALYYTTLRFCSKTVSKSTRMPTWPGTSTMPRSMSAQHLRFLSPCSWESRTHSPLWKTLASCGTNCTSRSSIMKRSTAGSPPSSSATT